MRFIAITTKSSVDKTELIIRLIISESTSGNDNQE